MQSQRASAELAQRDVRHNVSLEFIVQAHLARLLDSEHFDGSARSRAFLTFIVDEVLAGRGALLSQAVIASAVFGRRGDFDPVLDPIVRVQAGRLRRSLERYYLLAHEADAIRIELPKGSYTPCFVVPSSDGAAGAMSGTGSRDSMAHCPIIVIHSFRVALPLDEALAARLTDELAVALCRAGEVRVARQEDLERLELMQHSAVQLELKGNLHREAEGDRYLAVRLVDRLTAEQVWGDGYRVAPLQEEGGESAEDTARMMSARIGAWYAAAYRCAASYRSETVTNLVVTSACSSGGSC